MINHPRGSESDGRLDHFDRAEAFPKEEAGPYRGDDGLGRYFERTISNPCSAKWCWEILKVRCIDAVECAAPAI